MLQTSGEHHTVLKHSQQHQHHSKRLISSSLSTKLTTIKIYFDYIYKYILYHILFEFMQSSYSLGKIQNLEEFRRPRTFWQGNVVFHRRKISYFNFT